MRGYIPGHARAYTLWAVVGFTLLTFIFSRDARMAFGVPLLMTGLFVADQATHLAQANHVSDALTPIEQLMQRYYVVSVFMGTLVALGGLILITYRS